MPHRRLRGAIVCNSAMPERLGQVRGRGLFGFTDQADGVRLVHAHCEIDDAPNVVRDVVLAAGRFDALHFRYVDTAGQLPEEHPVYDVWCTADGDCVFLKGEVGGCSGRSARPVTAGTGWACRRH